MRKKSLLYVVLTAVVLAAAAAGIGFVQFKGSAVDEESELYISSKASYGALTDSLMPRIRHRAAFRHYARRLNLEQTFKPGHYVLRRGMSVVEVARMLKLGLQTPVRVTINNVRTPAQLAGKLARQLDADSAALLRVVTSERVARELGFDSVTLFSMFIPDTYELWWTTTPEELVLYSLFRAYIAYVPAFFFKLWHKRDIRCNMSGGSSSGQNYLFHFYPLRSYSSDIVNNTRNQSVLPEK